MCCSPAVLRGILQRSDLEHLKISFWRTWRSRADTTSSLSRYSSFLPTFLVEFYFLCPFSAASLTAGSRGTARSWKRTGEPTRRRPEARTRCACRLTSISTLPSRSQQLSCESCNTRPPAHRTSKPLYNQVPPRTGPDAALRLAPDASPVSQLPVHNSLVASSCKRKSK